MHPQNSSTSNSEPRGRSAWRDIAVTAAWFVAALGAFEALCWAAFPQGPLGESQLRDYFWYGQSQEGKMRQLVETANLPPTSILYAGWINPETLQSGGATDADVAIYGSSFSGNMTAAMRELRPTLAIRFVGGPGAPLNHSYGMYELDRTMRRTKVAVVGVVSENVSNVLSMNNGTLLADGLMPYFSPRYDIVDGRIERTGTSLINSPDELKSALNHGSLWQEQLAVLAEHDAAYWAPLFAADVFDGSVTGRLLRRAVAKAHESRYSDAIHGSSGFKRDSYAAQVLDGLLLKMVADFRDEGAHPVVVLVATRQYDDDLGELLEPLLIENGIPFVNTFDVCPSTDLRSYIPDGHFTHECDLEIARRALALIDAALEERPE
jgi:hypothetical protein